jgi:hypothetical protein
MGEEGMIRKLATFAAALILSGCASTPPPAPPPPPPISEAPTVPLPPPPPEDSCKSGELHDCSQTDAFVFIYDFLLQRIKRNDFFNIDGFYFSVDRWEFVFNFYR